MTQNRYDTRMLLDAVPFAKVHSNTAIASFLQFLERKLGVFIGYNARDIPFGRADLSAQFALAEKLANAGIVAAYHPSERFPDDPPFKLWGAHDKDGNQSGGISATNDGDALSATLSEALERYIWKEETDYFKKPLRASTRQMQKRGWPFVAPERFAGFSKEQRQKEARLRFDDETEFLWIEGTSLVSGKKTHVPAQVVAGARLPNKEPVVRTRNTTGLATWPTQIGARLGGIMECIERDAYMVMWLNQLSLPRLSLASLAEKNAVLALLLERCERYRMRVHAVPLLTDAPTHAMMVVIEDLSNEAPRFALGLKTHRSLSQAVEKALLEALRAHRSGRRQAARGLWDTSIQVKDIGHFERTHYYTLPTNAKHLQFLVAGVEREATAAPWEGDSVEQHLVRIANWCREKKYECVAVPLTATRKNPTSLHVEMMVMPELHPMHLYEKDLGADSSRLASVPKQFGSKPRASAFIERPHPFA